MKLEMVAEEKMELKKDRLQSNPVVTLAAALTANVWVFDPKKWLKVTQVLPWIQTFVSNCKLSGDHQELGELRVEITEAEIKIITMQQNEFAEEYKCLTLGKELSTSSKILPLNPWIDENSLTRSGGRLENADYQLLDVSYNITKRELDNKVEKDIMKKIITWQVIIKPWQRYDRDFGSRSSITEEVRECDNNCYGCKKRKAKKA